MMRICWNTLSHFSYQTSILMCARAIAVSMLAARLFLFPIRNLLCAACETSAFPFIPVYTRYMLFQQRKNTCQPHGTTQPGNSSLSHPAIRNHCGAIVITCSCGADRHFLISGARYQNSPFHCWYWLVTHSPSPGGLCRGPACAACHAF